MNKKGILIIFICLFAIMESACDEALVPAKVSQTTGSFSDVPPSSGGIGTRDSTPKCLVPSQDGDVVFGNEAVSIDASQVAHGYISVRYLGAKEDARFRITGSDQITYNYQLNNDYSILPLSCGTDDYLLELYENLEGRSYLKLYSDTIHFQIDYEFDPWLYPNQYCDFNSETKSVKKAEELARSAGSDLEVVTSVYNHVITTYSYDYNKADTVKSGYVPVLDDVYDAQCGICLDFSSIMCSMLRSQGIPTRIETGYVDAEVFHAWISVYLKEIGWVNGIIEFDGKNWKMMDPTFAADLKEKDLKKYIGNGTRYQTKYIY